MSVFKILDPITGHKRFDAIAGAVALANPIALLPGVLAIYQSETGEGQSILMWVIFFVLQIVFALVGAKARNHGAFWSMVISALMSLCAIVMLGMK